MMSNFKIVHEIDGRLRVRFGQYAFTNEQATILKSDFLNLLLYSLPLPPERQIPG